MSNPIGTVVPHSINTPKKLAKKLSKIYPNASLADCQRVTAMLYGHKDWFNLEQAIKHKQPSAPFDDDLYVDAYSVRAGAQIRLLAKEFGGIEQNTFYMSENWPDWVQKQLVSEVNWNIIMGGREESATKRYYAILAEVVITDFEPTAEVSPQQVEHTDLPFTKCNGATAALLPTYLSDWWLKTHKDQPTVAASISSFENHMHSRASLLTFGAYWGSLCLYYAESIPPVMAMGVSQMLAERYADLSLTAYSDMVEISERHYRNEITVDEFVNEVLALRHEHIKVFYEAIPRDDFLVIHLSQPVALVRNLESTMKKLGYAAS